MTKQKITFDKYVEQMGQLLDLPLDPEYLPGIVDNMARLAAISQLVTEFPLPENIEPAPVFEP